MRCGDWAGSAARLGVYLDLCAGTLDFGATLARQPGFAGRVVGADFVPAMLRAGPGEVRPARAGDRGRPRAAVSRCQLRRRHGRLGRPQPGGPRCRPGRGGASAQARRPPGHPRDGAPTATRCCARLISSTFGGCCPCIGRLISKHTTAYTWLPESTQAFPPPAELARRLTQQRFHRCAVWRAVLRRGVRAACRDQEADDRRMALSTTSANSSPPSTASASWRGSPIRCAPGWRSPRSPTA